MHDVGEKANEGLHEIKQFFKKIATIGKKNADEFREGWEQSSANRTKPQTLTAWGKIVMKLPSGELPFGTPTGLQMSLVATDNSYYDKIGSGSDAIAAALKSGVFTFKKVPVDKNIKLTIQFSAIGDVHQHESSHRLRKTRKKNPNPDKFYNEGYLGKFICDMVSGKVEKK